MNTYDLPNYRQFKVTFLSRTNHRGARVKITEPKRFTDGKTISVTLSYDYAIGDIEQQAVNHLDGLGFTLMARCSETNSYTLLCNNWGLDFIELTE